MKLVASALPSAAVRLQEGWSASTTMIAKGELPPVDIEDDPTIADLRGVRPRRRGREPDLAAFAAENGEGHGLYCFAVVAQREPHGAALDGAVDDATQHALGDDPLNVLTFGLLGSGLLTFTLRRSQRTLGALLDIDGQLALARLHLLLGRVPLHSALVMPKG